MPVEVLRSAGANADLVAILRWTGRRFGPAQAVRYGDMVIATLMSLQFGPELVGARLRPELGPGIWSIRAKPGRARSPHIAVFSFDPAAQPPTVRVLRIFHESMDIARHLLAEDPT